MEADKERLVSGRWLNSSLINASQKLLKKKFTTQKGLQDTVAKETSWKPVEGEFVQVIHIKHCHWVTVSNKFCPPATVRVYDSAPSVITADTKFQIAAMLQCKEAKLVIETMMMDQQVNGDDCGLHAVASAYELCAGKDPTSIKWKHNELRSHLLTCLENEQMKPFPKAGRRRDGVVASSVQFSLFCICRMPENRSSKMAQCLSCGEWFHQSCCRIPMAVFSRKREPFTCDVCMH